MIIDESQETGCVTSPGLSSSMLMAAIDGELDAQIQAHLDACPSCAADVQQMRRFQRQLHVRLYRLFCPTTDLLVDYCQGLLDPYQRAQITHHIALCPHCAREVALMESLEPLPDHSAPRSMLSTMSRSRISR